MDCFRYSFRNYLLLPVLFVLVQPVVAGYEKADKWQCGEERLLGILTQQETFPSVFPDSIPSRSHQSEAEAGANSGQSLQDQERIYEDLEFRKITEASETEVLFSFFGDQFRPGFFNHLRELVSYLFGNKFSLQTLGWCGKWCRNKSQRRFIRDRSRHSSVVSKSRQNERSHCCQHAADWSFAIAILVAPLAFLCFFTAVRLHMVRLSVQRSERSLQRNENTAATANHSFPVQDAATTSRHSYNRWVVLMERLSEAGSISFAKRGLLYAEIRSIPTETYASTNDVQPAPLVQCAICLESIFSGDKIKRVPGCHHPFHEHCLNQWLVQSASCPLCRCNVVVNAK